MQPQVALSKDFMESYSQLPKAQQKKVREFTEKFQQDPTRSGINFERIVDARDPKVRSVRIDQAYRAIVVHPPKGDIYLCVWVDRHEDAYRWVRDKCFEVNPRSGTFQLFDMRAVEPEPTTTERPTAVAEERHVGLFDKIDDEDLLLAGVPAPLLPAVRAIRVEPDLDRLSRYLPEEAAELLYMLAAGYSLVDAIEESARKRPAPGTVDVQDFKTALERPESQQSFYIVSDQRELEEILDAPLEKWRIFLHPSQRRLVEMKSNGPVQVIGSAGTGKTVVLMHRAKHLVSTVFTNPGDRILVTTFTRNLALDLQANLRNLCGDLAQRLDVTNLHSWAMQFMRRQGHTFQVVSEAEQRTLFNLAISECDVGTYSVPFFREEWNRVVQDQDVSTLDEYFSARRTGRGTRMTRPQRAEVWHVFERYRELLRNDKKVEWPDVIRETRLYMEKNGLDAGYCAVVADEVQDFTAGELRLLRRIAPNRPDALFLAGDGHQRIYGHPVRLSACGIDIRGRSRRLKLNYRTTEEIRNRAIAVLKGCQIDDLDGGQDTLKGFKSLRHGPAPEIQHFKREADEAEFIVARIKKWLQTVPPEAICVAARTNAQLRDRYERILTGAGIATVVVEREPESEARRGGVRLATLHRMKGLEFSRVLLVGAQAGAVPLAVEGLADEASRQDNELQERCLFYVGATRARDELVITGYGQASPFLA